jgi:hypothetical protein
MALAPVPSDEEIIELFKADRLVEELITYHEREADGDTRFAARCAALHNDRKIDLLAVANSEPFASLSPTDFFAAQHVFVAAIPDMKSSRREIMELCQLLVLKAGSDGAAYRPNGSIRSWFANNPHEAVLAVEGGVNGDELATKFMTFALQAGNMIEQSLEIARRFSDDRRLSAIHALAAMDYKDKTSRTGTIASLLSYLDASQSDLTRANALQALLKIASPLSDPAQISQIINSAVLAPGDQTHHSLSQILWLNSKDLGSGDKTTILSALKSVNPQHKGTLDQLDQGLSQMLSGPDEAIALSFLKDFIATHDLSIEQFDSVEHKLRGGTGNAYSA